MPIVSFQTFRSRLFILLLAEVTRFTFIFDVALQYRWATVCSHGMCSVSPYEESPQWPEIRFTYEKFGRPVPWRLTTRDTAGTCRLFPIEFALSGGIDFHQTVFDRNRN